MTQVRPPMLALRPWLWTDPKPWGLQFNVEAALADALKELSPPMLYVPRRPRT